MVVVDVGLCAMVLVEEARLCGRGGRVRIVWWWRRQDCVVMVEVVGLCGRGGDDKIVWGWLRQDCVVVVEAELCGGGRIV